MRVKNYRLMQSQPDIMQDHPSVRSWRTTPTVRVSAISFHFRQFLLILSSHPLILVHVQFSDAKLLRAVDSWKDQTFFLSQIPQNALRRTMFPIGDLLKSDAKQLAIDAGLGAIARKKESMGICFVGKRSFKEFISEYIVPKPGIFIDIDTGKIVGKHNGFHHYTIGQGISIKGQLKRNYVLRKMADGTTILVAGGLDNLAFFSRLLFTEKPHWIDHSPFDESSKCVNVVDLKFCFQHINPLQACSVTRSNEGRGLLMALRQPLRAIAPGQYAVLYRNDECLGSAKILAPGPSQRTLALSSSYKSDGELTRANSSEMNAQSKLAEAQ